MSTFAVKSYILNEILAHPNADALELAVIGGYRAVVKKGIFKVGDIVVYIPNDSVVPEFTANELGIMPYLVGKSKNRVKAIRLRGEVSQGIVLPWEVVANFTPKYHELAIPKEDVDFTEMLGITKYEEPIPAQMSGRVRSWPGYLDKYDIENVNNPDFIHVFEHGELVFATEKIHGSNMSVSIGEGLKDGEYAFVCSRNMALQEHTNNVYWMAAQKYHLITKLYDMLNSSTIFHVNETPLTSVEITIRGELVGTQDLKYGFDMSDPGFFAFDLRIMGLYAPYSFFVELCNQFEIPRVPEIYRGPYDYTVLKKLSSGMSTIPGANHIREGIVVKPEQEKYIHGIGRKFVKFINEDYLVRKGGTELH